MSGPALKALGRFLGGGMLRLVAGSDDELSEIAEAMVQDEMEDATLKLASLSPADRKIWRARAKAALVGLDRIIERASR